MPTVTMNGVTLFYRAAGEGADTIVFSHGYLMDHTMFEEQIATLSKHFRCVAFDHRGHGRSAVTAEGYALDNLVTDAIALIESLGTAPVHFVGMSTGGFVGLRVALRRPDLLRSMVLMNTSAAAEDANALMQYNLLLWVVKYIGWWVVIGRVMPILFHETFLDDPSRQQEVQYWKDVVTGHAVEGVYPFGKGIFARDSIVHQLPQITTPTAVIVGEEDVATPPEYAHQLADGIPDTTLYTIPDAGHSAAVEKPAQVTDAMTDFYQSQGIL